MKPGTGRGIYKVGVDPGPTIRPRVLSENRRLMGILPMLIELGAAVLLEGLVSKGGEAPSLSGNRVVMVVGLGEVAISVVEVKLITGQQASR